METPIAELELNVPQARNMLAHARVWASPMGRGTGKTTDAAWFAKEGATQMPRATGALVQRSYKLLLENTLPPLVTGLEKLGYIEDKHFWIGKPPPKGLNIPRPIQGPKTFEHTIYWYTGFVDYLVSQDRKDSFRGPSVQRLLLDEAVYLHFDRLQQEVFPALRGLRNVYGGNKYYRSIKFASSKPIGQQGRWLLDFGKYYAKDGHNHERIYKELLEIELGILEASTPDERKRLFLIREETKKKLRYYTSDKGVFYSEGNIFDNLENVGFAYIYDLYTMMWDRNRIKFLVEVLNVTMDEVEGTFYPALDDGPEGHVYYGAIDYSRIEALPGGARKNIKQLDSRDCTDINPHLPLITGWDWGKNSVVLTAQRPDPNRIMYTKEVFALHPEYLNDLIGKWLHFFRHHRNKTVYVHYDHTGDSAVDTSPYTRFQQVQAALSKEGWKVVQGYNRQIDPGAKYDFWNKILRADDPSLPRVMFNGDNCAKTIKSMQLAPIKQGYKGIKKDKSSEGDDNFPQDEATHASDAADILLVGEFDPKPRGRIIEPTIR